MLRTSNIFSFPVTEILFADISIQLKADFMGLLDALNKFIFIILKNFS